jgi:hypothetical protein
MRVSSTRDARDAFASGSTEVSKQAHKARASVSESTTCSEPGHAGNSTSTSALHRAIPTHTCAPNTRVAHTFNKRPRIRTKEELQHGLMSPRSRPRSRPHPPCRLPRATPCHPRTTSCPPFNALTVTVLHPFSRLYPSTAPKEPHLVSEYGLYTLECGLAVYTLLALPQTLAQIKYHCSGGGEGSTSSSAESSAAAAAGGLGGMGGLGGLGSAVSTAALVKASVIAMVGLVGAVAMVLRAFLYRKSYDREKRRETWELQNFADGEVRKGGGGGAARGGGAQPGEGGGACVRVIVHARRLCVCGLVCGLVCVLGECRH